MGDAAKDENTDWISISNLAKARGVTHQAISKRIRALSRRGNLPTRQAGKVVLIHRPSFEALAAAVHDPAQDLRNRRATRAAIATARETAELIASTVDANIAPTPTGAYDDAVAREKNAKAALAEMELARKRGELVQARDIEQATVTVGTAIAQRIASLKARSGELYAASRGGEDALRVLLVTQVDEALRAISEDMQKLAIDGERTKAPPRPN